MIFSLFPLLICTHRRTEYVYAVFSLGFRWANLSFGHSAGDAYYNAMNVLTAVTCPQTTAKAVRGPDLGSSLKQQR